MAWFIREGFNNGYPALNSWRESWQTDWSTNGDIRYPDYIWRIKQGINGDYPWVYPWFKQSSTDTGEMVIGGSISNYPSGFTGSNLGGIENDFNSNSMFGGGSGGGNLANNALKNSLAGRAFVLSGTTLSAILDKFNDRTMFTASEAEYISRIYGANVFDSILSCKVFPFDISALRYIGGSSSIIDTPADVKAFGSPFYVLAQNVNTLGSNYGYYFFPTITVTPLQAWEIENIDFSIYLPMAGVFPLDLRGACNVDVQLMVDLLGGTGEYYVYLDEQLIGTYRVLLGADVPINNNQGRMQANMLTNVVSSFSKSLGAISGAVMGGGVGAMVGLGTSMLTPTEHYAMNTPSVGGVASMQCNPFPRIVAKIPKMFRDGFGYKQTLGMNRSTTYVRLNECSGFIKCKNYKTDIIVATDTEKTEIERLMNEGVFV